MTVRGVELCVCWGRKQTVMLVLVCGETYGGSKGLCGGSRGVCRGTLKCKLMQLLTRARMLVVITEVITGLLTLF